MLKSCDRPLAVAYDLALLDLDGVVYVGARAVPGAPGHVAAARASGMRTAFVTNNASRPPAVVAAHLRELGLDAPDSEVVTAGQAAARLLAEQLAPGSKVFVIGGQGLFEALGERDLVPVQSIEDEPVAVVEGFHQEVRWGTVMQGAVLVARGLPWVASNTDMTVPTAYGRAPGNGLLVDAVARFADRTPVVAGKPEPPLFRESVARVGGARPLVVGDRLDTDIEGANRAGYDSLLVLTGVTGLAELVVAPAGRRPTYIAPDLGGLLRPHAAPCSGELGGWTARVTGGELQVTGDGDPAAWWAVVADAAWSHLDATGVPAATVGVVPPGTV